VTKLKSQSVPSFVSRPELSANVCGIVEAMSIAYNTKVYDLKRAGIELCVLSLGEAFFELPEVDFRDLPHPAIFHYSDSRGIPELRESIAAYYGSQYGARVDPAREILITAGSKAAIYMALLCVLDPGEEVLIPEPAWVSYTEQVRLAHGSAVGIPHSEPIERWERYITSRTKVLIVNNPHNPTGYRYSAAELRALVDLAKRHGLWLFSDEAYSDFTLDRNFVTTAHYDEDKTNVVVFNSISKNYGISGWRLGYVIAGEALVDQILKVQQHVVTCAPTILEYYIAKHFERILDVTKPQIAALIDKRVRIAAYMESIGLDCSPGDCTFYFFLCIDPSSLTSEQFATRLLEEYHIAVVPGIGYGNSCDRFVRVSIGTECSDDITRALLEIKRFIDATSNSN